MSPSSNPQPDGPKNFLGLGNVKRFSEHTLDFIVELQAKYGDVAKFRMGPYTAFFFYHPDHVREILTTHWKKLPKMKRQVEVLRQWDGNGLLLSEGEFWQRQHRLVQPAFGVKCLGRYAEMMVELTQRRLDQWNRLANGAEISIDEHMRQLTIEIISKTMFGADVESTQARALEQAVLDLSEISVAEMKMIAIPPKWLPTAHNRRKFSAIKLLDGLINGFIKEKRARETDDGDFLSMMLMARDDEGKGGGMTDQQVRDEAMVLFLAGHDTTATNLIWTWYLLATHPGVEAKAYAEVQMLGERPPTAADLPRLKYLRQVISESLRLYPPAIGTFARQPTEDLTIGGVSVPKDSFVYTFSYVTQRDPRWFQDPEKFDPDRFSPELERQIPPFAYFPFGGGPRVCIGMQFSMMEATLVIASVLQRYRLKLVPGQNVKPEVRLSLTPKDPIRFTLEKR